MWQNFQINNQARPINRYRSFNNQQLWSKTSLTNRTCKCTPRLMPINCLESKKTKQRFTTKWTMWHKRSMIAMNRMEHLTSTTREVRHISRMRTILQQVAEMARDHNNLGRPTRILCNKCSTKGSQLVGMFLSRQKIIIWQWKRRKRWILTEFKKTLKSAVLIKKCENERPRRKEKPKSWTDAHLRLN